jgi:hypothetical protein
MDVAALSLKVDSSDVVKATADLDRFAAASAKAGSSARQGSIAKMAQDFARTADQAGRFSNSAARAADAAQQAARAASAGSSSLVRFGDGYDILTGKLNSNFVAINRNIEAWNRQGKAVNDNVGQMRANTGNIAAQFQDIGVTAAMGMNPLIIALQQGTQLSAVLAQSGGGALATLRAAFASILSPAALLTIALVAGAAALIQWASSAGDSASASERAAAGLKTYTKEMGYTKEEVKKLNAVSVTWGDTIKAVFQVGWQRIASAFGVNTKQIASAWSSTMDFLVRIGRGVVANLYTMFAGIGYVIKRVIDNAKAGTFENPFTTFAEGSRAAYNDAQRFMDDVGKQAAANARARQAAMAAEMYDKPKGDGGKSVAEKIADLLRQAQADVDAEKLRLQAMSMSAQAAAELEQRTKLLNDAKQAGIRITPKLAGEIDQLSKAYAKAKIAADTAAAVQSVTDSMEKQLRAINDETATIGLYGDELLRARNELDMLRAAKDALPKGVELSAADATRIAADAGRVSDDQILQLRLKRMADLRKASEDAAYAMDLEAKGLGLTGEAAIRHAFVTDELNRAKREGITLTPEYVAAIEAAGDAYAAQRYAIDQTRQAIADAREVTRGFFSDWINGAREGKNVFTALADAAVNALNRIIDKLLDRTLDMFLDSMFQGGGGVLGGLFGGKSGGAMPKSPFGGLWHFDPVIKNALGGVYGDIKRFANGGTFTNSIVSEPTLFRFANGGKLGEMGEAGPEAIMPLARDSMGRLGVRSQGRESRKAEIHVNNSYHLAGAIAPETIVAMIEQGNAQTEQHVRNNLLRFLQEIDMDGTNSRG